VNHKFTNGSVITSDVVIPDHSPPLTASSFDAEIVKEQSEEKSIGINIGINDGINIGISIGITEKIASVFRCAEAIF
jgi:hypothetical protein